MGKSDMSTVSSLDCRNVLDSILNEYDQFQKEETSLSKLHEELVYLIAQRNVLEKKKSFNEKNCIICCLAFNLLFKRKLFCQDCRLWVCRSCSTWDNVSKQWLCHICEKQKLLNAASTEWICNRIKSNFGNFNAAKALQNFYRNRRISADSENDSGYGAAGSDFMLVKFLSSHSLYKDIKMTDTSFHDDDSDDLNNEEELFEIQDSIETILEGLLGNTLDDALIDKLYPTSTFYLNLFDSYHTKLIKVIEDLSQALQKALHNLPVENGITPTAAHAALKNVISSLVDDCQHMPSLQDYSKEDLKFNVEYSFDFPSIISSYSSLVAAAVINKVVEENQSKFKTCTSTYSEERQNSRTEAETCSTGFPSVTEDGSEYFDHSILNSTSFNLPVKSVKIEEIEEITQEFTDSEDDKLSSISKCSNTLQNFDDAGVNNQSNSDIFMNLDCLSEIPTPFPEYGFDLVECFANEDFQSPIYPLTVSTWEENWLFRKKKRLPLYRNLRYQLLTYYDEPPSMLIPCPTESVDVVEQEELSSELSETHSAGSLEFSSDSESKDSKESILQNQFISKSVIRTDTNSSHYLEVSKEKFYQELPNLCHHEELNFGEPSDLNNSKSPLKEESDTSQDCLEEYHLSYDREICIADNSIRNSYVETPPKPGTIAEREHKKWLNAIPLKNNPYSAENISKRYKGNKLIEGIQPVSSFEEFERKLSISSDTDVLSLNKVNCGPKSIDSTLYKRDYYVNNDMESPGTLYYSQKLPKHSYVASDDCFSPLSDEALNSFEEKVYVKSGKVFPLKNHVKRLEREIKDNSLSPELPKKSAQPIMVHSLTARSLSREFRDLAKQNLPKPMNRTISVGVCNESEQPKTENMHGYTSDESNTSSSSTKKSKRHISRSILERATYWERRAEQGLLSDASVNEEFPALDE